MLRKASSYILRLVTNAYPLCLIYVHIAKHRLKNNISRLHELSEFVKFLQSFKVMGVRVITLAQVEEEIVELLRILKTLKPRICLEIGTAGGGTLFLFAQVANPDATLISIDLPGGPFGGAIRLGRYPSISRSPGIQPRESTC